MVTALVGTLESLFVSKGTKVLMTSHSPMTVAAVDEAAIFRSSGRAVASRSLAPQNRRLSTSCPKGLPLWTWASRSWRTTRAKVTILTEGNNVKHPQEMGTPEFSESVQVSKALSRIVTIPNS